MNINLEEQYKEIKNNYNFFKQNLNTFLLTLRDSSISLDERWKLFLKLINDDMLNEIDGAGDGHICILNPKLTLYDDFYIERHQTVTYATFFERIMGLDEKIPEENLIKWKEKVLEERYSGFQNDW